MASPGEGVAPSLRRTLLRWLLIPLLALLLVDTLVSGWTAQRAADLAHDRSLNELARELVLHVEAAPAGTADAAGGQGASRDSGLRLSLTPAAERILLVDEEDRIAWRIADAQGRTLGGEAVLPLPTSAARPGGPPVYYGGQLQGERVRLLAWWLPVQPAAPAVAGAAGASSSAASSVSSSASAPTAQWVLVQVAETRHQRNALLREIMVHVLLPQLLLVLAALALVAFGVRHGLLPLEVLRGALARRSHRALEPLDLAPVPADLRPLVAEMNALMARLGQTLDVQNRFIADAAHQLKTPVSGLKAQIELALREEDPQRLRHSLAQVHVGVERLSRLVRQLLALARNEPEAAASLAMAPTDLTDLALQVSMEWVPQALRRQIDLGFDGPGRPVIIHADADRLRELLNNLVDNAVRYSRESGKVTVALEVAVSGEACLSVHDDGPHIPPEERERVFQRFHRVLGTQADGSGLGLAIVSEIASLHGARITLDEDDDGIGNTFRVWFPLSPPAAPPDL